MAGQNRNLMLNFYSSGQCAICTLCNCRKYSCIPMQCAALLWQSRELHHYSREDPSPRWLHDRLHHRSAAGGSSDTHQPLPLTSGEPAEDACCGRPQTGLCHALYSNCSVTRGEGICTEMAGVGCMLDFTLGIKYKESILAIQYISSTIAADAWSSAIPEDRGL